MNYAVIENGKVTNVIVMPDDFVGSEFGGFDVVPAGSASIGDEYVNGVFVRPEPSAPTPTPSEIEARKVALVQHHMDEAARALRYDDIRTAVTYAEEPAVPKFQVEGQAFRAWRSLVWAACYAILDEVNNGVRPIPTDEDLIAELPKLAIPDFT